MQVSFVIPLYNQLALSQVCLASLRATLPRGLDYEIVLVDDGSTDGTREWLATLRDDRVRVVLNERNLGYAAANNRAIATARGDLLALLNNDLELLPGWLPPLLAARRRLGARAGIVGNVQRNHRTGEIDHVGIDVDRKTKPFHSRHRPPLLLRWLFPIRRVPAVTGACILLDRSLWNELGGFDAEFVNGGEDVDLCLRARAAGRINAVALRSVVRHHVSASGGRHLRDEENSRRLARKWRSDLEASDCRPWSWHYLDRHWTSPTDRPDYVAAAAVLFYILRLRPRPPQLTREGVRAAMNRELARWQNLLGA